MGKLFYAFIISTILFVFFKILIVIIYKVLNFLLKNKNTESSKFDVAISFGLNCLYIYIWSICVSVVIKKFGLAIIEEYMALCMLGMFFVIWCYFSWDIEHFLRKPCIATKEEQKSKKIIVYFLILIFTLSHGYQQAQKAIGVIKEVDSLFTIANSSIIVGALALDRLLNQFIVGKESNEKQKEGIKIKRKWHPEKKEKLFEIIGCFIIAVSLVLGLLIMVLLFEKMDIHVPGSRDMWMGVIGAVLGGAFTLIGVLFTNYFEEKEKEKQKRLENMPILGFKIIEYDDARNEDIDCFLSCYDGEFVTSGFSFIEGGIWSLIKIWNLNEKNIFDFTVEAILINGKQIKMGEAFNPSMRRLIKGEELKILFFFEEEVEENMFCVLRFSYKDLFGNKYYQDLPYIYAETYQIEDEIVKRKQIIEIRDIKSPIFLMEDDKTFKEHVKEYEDYDTFC